MAMSVSMSKTMAIAHGRYWWQLAIHRWPARGIMLDADVLCGQVPVGWLRAQAVVFTNMDVAWAHPLPKVQSGQGGRMEIGRWVSQKASGASFRVDG